MKTLIIQGSSRSKGNTSQIAKILQQNLGGDILDLRQKNIHSYDYDHSNQQDDFLPVIREAVEYDLVLLITPVYWYSMSGIMKNFMDRITDCLKVEKETGRRLRGKYLAAVACGSDNTQTDGFFVPFKNSAGYLGMTYLGSLHTWIGSNHPTEEVLTLINEFVEKIVTNKNTLHS
jgi:multimeric flavodoxin WrbA